MLKFATVLSTLAVLAFSAPAFACPSNGGGNGGGCPGDQIACPSNGGGNGGCPGDQIACGGTCPGNGGGNGGGNGDC